MTGVAPARVAICHHNRLFREILAEHLGREPDLTVAGTAGLGPELIKLCGLRRPSVAVFEADAPVWSNERLVAGVLRAAPGVRMVGVHQALPAAYVIRAFGAGVSAMVPYASGLRTLVDTLREPVLPVEVAREHEGGGALTERESEVLYLISAGYQTSRIAAELDISPHTVEHHTQRVFAKLDARNKPHAAATAVRLGLARSTADAILAGEPVRVEPGPDTDTLTDRVRDIVATHATRTSTGPVTVLVDPEPDWPTRPATGGVRIVVTTRYSDQRQVADALAVGATLVPAAQLDELLPIALSAAARGHVLVEGTRAPGQDPVWARWRLALTPRERDILTSISAGHTTKQTARRLGISARTVENLQGSLYRKLRVHNRSAALAAAHDLDLL